VTTQTLTISLPRPHAGQQRVLQDFAAARFGVLVCGRRWGKSNTGRYAIVETALNGGVAWWISPTYKMASEAWRDFKLVLQPVTKDKNEVEHRLELITGGTIQVWSGHAPDSLRGVGLDLAVLDEAAYLHPDVWRAAIRPALSDKQGKALFLSTPNGRNWFWSLWMRSISHDASNWAGWKFATSDGPIVTAAEVEEAREMMPERWFRQEYLAEFLDDGGVVFRNIRDCATAPMKAQYDETHRYVFGVDWARDNDWTVIVVMDTTTRQMVAMERFNQIGWTLQRARLASLAAIWHPEIIWAEANSIGGPNIEALQMDGLPVQGFMTTAQSKEPLIQSLALGFEKREFAIQDDDILTGELQAFSLERLPSGRYRYSAPPGEHDDCVIALALAWHGCINSGIGISFT
jgi:hypothetical protein